MRNEKIPSEFDGLKLEVAIATPVEIPKAVSYTHLDVYKRQGP